MDKKADKKRKKELRKEYEERPREISEDEYLENNSYYDIDILEEHNKPIREEIRYWKEEFKPTGNMGKWYASVRIAKLEEKLKGYQNGE